MIVAVNEGLAFIKIPKNASSAISRWIYLNCEKTKGNPNGHQTIRSATLPEGIKSFCFIRDPIERFLSACRYLRKGGNQSDSEKQFGEKLTEIGSDSDIAKALMTDKQVGQFLHFIPQHNWVSVGGDVVVDYLFSYKKNIQWMSGVLSGLMKQPVKLERINSTAESEYDRYPIPEDTESVLRDYYKKDYEIIEKQKLSFD